MALKQSFIDKQPFKGKIAVLCGASKGIGKATAGLIVRLGGSVCIVAREAEVLSQAQSEIEVFKRTDAQFVEVISCDASDMEALKPPLTEFVERRGVPDYLLNLVGITYPDYIQNLTLDNFKQHMDVNYYGVLVPTLILLPYFMESKKGHIANVSSLVGFGGVVGYASYSPTKFAVVGLAEVLRHELKSYNVQISVFFPQDTDTPGFEIERQIRPPELDLMAEATNAKLISSEQAAEVFIVGLLKKKFKIFTSETNLLWILKRHVPGIIHFYLDYSYAQAKKKLGKE
jgi:3-dehydrosphinganine reductase